MKKLSFLFLLISGIVIIGMTSCQKEPTASFTTNKDSIGARDTIRFSNTSSEGDHYEWNFGDGQTSTDKEPNHIYTTAGKYTITLKAISKNGKKSNEVTEAITVIAKNFDYESMPYILSNGVLMKYSVSNYIYEMGIILYSGYTLETSGNNITHFNGTGNYVRFMFYANDSTILSPGAFNFLNIHNLGTFGAAEFAMDYNMTSATGNKYRIDGGSLNIIKLGTNYEIKFTCTDELGKNLKGTYFGTLKYYNPYFQTE
jgi:PKD repeat protein